jgi:AraC family ethanolamine operon transcriptional activator
MIEHLPAPMLVPKVFQFGDIDTFRSAIRTLDVEFIPLARRISSEQTILHLPGCDVNYTKSFPRVIDGTLAPNTTAVGFTMDDGVPIRFNGAERDRSVIVVGHGGAAYHAVERTPRQYASIVFTPAVDDRGWPDTGLNFGVHEISESAQDHLRALVLQVLSVAPQHAGQPDAIDTAAAIRESLLAAIDHAFAEIIPAKWTARANASPQLKVFSDVRAALAGDMSQPIYSGDLAHRIGVSVRTLHDAVQRYRGMSLHRYLRLKRLWLVRKQLVAGTHSVKAAALAFGFWHLSDFSRSYRAQFGESPSETLARSRQA